MTMHRELPLASGRRAPSIGCAAMQDGLPDLFRAGMNIAKENGMAGKMIRVKMSDGAEIGVYHAEPEGERRGGLVLIQEIFGVTEHIRELCDEYAADRYEVLAPALFDREHPGFEADYSGEDFQRAVQLARELHPFEQSLADAQTCVDALKDKGPVFMTGYCYGGSVTWAMAGQSNDLAAASCYYGSLIPTMFKDRKPKCPTIAHFGRYDMGIPTEGVDALIATKPDLAEIFVYEAGHGFNSDRRKDYHEESADLARERTLALFKACDG